MDLFQAVGFAAECEYLPGIVNCQQTAPQKLVRVVEEFD